MTVKEELIYFLKNGKLENIKFGIKRKELVSLIGEPDFVLPEKSKLPTLFEYDNIEFYFEDESENARLKTIQIEHPISYSKNGNLVFESYGWNTNLNLEEAIEFLKNHRIEFEEKPDPNNPDLFRRLITDSDVFIYFTNQSDDKNWRLYSLGRTIQIQNPIKLQTKN